MGRGTGVELQLLDFYGSRQDHDKVDKNRQEKFRNELWPTMTSPPINATVTRIIFVRKKYEHQKHTVKNANQIFYSYFTRQIVNKVGPLKLWR